MLATYSPSRPGKRLNVRREPSPAAPVVRAMEAGTEEATEVARGWVRLADGWADARFLTVTEGFENLAIYDTADNEAAKAAAEAEAEQAEAERAATDEEARAGLMKLAKAELFKLAEDSGIKVAKDSTKDELVSAILADE